MKAFKKLWLLPPLLLCLGAALAQTPADLLREGKDAVRKGNLLEAYFNFRAAQSAAAVQSDLYWEARDSLGSVVGEVREEYRNFQSRIRALEERIRRMELEGEKLSLDLHNIQEELDEQTRLLKAQYRRAEAQRLTILAIQKVEQGSPEEALRLAYLAEMLAEKDAGMSKSGMTRAFGDAVFRYRSGRVSIEAPLLNVAFLPKTGQVIAAGKQGNIAVWNNDDTNLTPYSTFLHTPALLTAGYSDDGDYLYTTSIAADTSVRIWSLAGREPLPVSEQHQSDVYGARVLPDGERLLTWSRDRTARIRNIEAGDPGSVAFAHDAPVQSARLSPGGDVLLTRGNDGQVLVWDKKGEKKGVIRHEAYIYSAEFSPDGRYILTASADGSARLWDVNQQLREFKSMTHEGLVTKAVFNHAGNRILSTSTDSTARLWALKDMEPLTWDQHEGWVVEAAFSQNDSLAMTRSKAGDVWIWDIPNRSVSRLNGHRDKINQAVFSPDSRYVLTASDDRTAKLWDTQGNIVMDLDGFNSPVTHVDFSGDGYLLAAAADGTIVVSPLPETVRAELDQKPFKEIYSKVLQYGIDCDDWKAYLGIDLECP